MSSFHCVLHPVGCPRNDVSCVATIKHECRSSTVLCIPEAALLNLLDASCVATIKRACTLVALYNTLYIFCCTLFVVWNVPEYYFVVRSSAVNYGIVRR